MCDVILQLEFIRIEKAFNLLIYRSFVRLWILWSLTLANYNGLVTHYIRDIPTPALVT